MSFSRILNDVEILVAANTNPVSGWSGRVLVDSILNPAGSTFSDLFTNKAAPGMPGHVSTVYGLASVEAELRPLESGFWDAQFEASARPFAANAALVQKNRTTGPYGAGIIQVLTARDCHPCNGGVTTESYAFCSHPARTLSLCGR